MLHDIFMHRDRGHPKEESAEDHSNDTGNPSEDAENTVSFIENRYSSGYSREGPSLRHNGQANLLTGKQAGRLLPSHGPKLDFMLMV